MENLCGIKLINLYVDINPKTKKIFYVGVGTDCRIKKIKRNKYHNIILESLPNQKFIRKIIYKNITQEKAWKIEKQIIKKCGRIANNSGYLANIHSGGCFLRKNINEIDWRKGKSAKEIYGEDYQGPANKGKTYKQLKGNDYILPTAKPFFIQIDDEIPIFCESESYFCNTFNSNDMILRKFKKSKENGHKITRQLNSSNYFSDKSIIKLIPCNIEDNPKLDINIINDIISRQKEKIENWVFLKNNKNEPKTKKYLNYKYKFPFNIIINDNDPVYCISETDCCDKFKCDRSLIGRIKKLPNMTYYMKTRAGSAKHIFPDNSTIRIEYVN